MVPATAASPAGPDVAMAAPEGAAHSVPPTAQDAVPEVGLMKEDMVRGSLGIVTVVGRTRRELPLTLLLGGSRSPARGEPPIQWMAA